MGPFATHRLFARAALSGAHIFGWLFAFQYYFAYSGSLTRSLASVAVLYALSQVVAILLSPYAARRLRHGIRGLMVNALLSLAGAYALLAAAFSGTLGSISLGVLCFAILMGVYRALYWIPYEFAARKRVHGHVLEVALSFVPALAGYVISLSSVSPLLVLAAASILALIAIIPLYAMRDAHEGFRWGYRETFQNLFSRSHRRPLLLALCNGIEGAALLLLWPIAMLVLLHWSYLVLGLVISFTYLATIAIRRLLAPVERQARTPILLSILTFSGWMIRGAVASPVSIVLANAYYHSGSGITERGVDLLVSEQSADGNTYLDEFTTLKDMGQGIGRAMFAIALSVLAPVMSFGGVSLLMFFAASVVGIASIALSRHARRQAF